MKNANLSRQSFLRGIFATTSLTALGGSNASGTATASSSPKMPMEPQALQKLIDDVSPAAYAACRDGGEPTLPALRIYDDALARAVQSIAEADVSRRPAVAYVYNMGVLVRTKERFFSIDLCHRRSRELCDKLDFALVTHNHGDHYIDSFLQDMDRRGKTAITNFDDNYGAHFAGKNPGGFTRGGKNFQLGDVAIRTSTSDHNPYLIDYTMPFEITVGDYTIYHTGDSQNLKKLNPTQTPDLWIVHPICGLDVVKAAQKFRPRLTVIAHLNEMGHAKNNARWTFADGAFQCKNLEKAGFKAIMPLWGDRLA